MIGGGAAPARRSLSLTADLLRLYSRRGNFHSEEGEAAGLGLPGLVAQGMQVVAPAYGVLLDAWGDEFLAHGTFEATFVSMVAAGDTVEAVVTVDAGPAGAVPSAAFEVRVGDRVAAVGRGAPGRLS